MFNRILRLIHQSINHFVLGGLLISSIVPIQAQDTPKGTLRGYASGAAKRMSSGASAMVGGVSYSLQWVYRHLESGTKSFDRGGRRKIANVLKRFATPSAQEKVVINKWIKRGKLTPEEAVLWQNFRKRALSTPKAFRAIVAIIVAVGIAIASALYVRGKREKQRRREGVRRFWEEEEPRREARRLEKERIAAQRPRSLTEAFQRQEAELIHRSLQQWDEEEAQRQALSLPSGVLPVPIEPSPAILPPMAPPPAPPAPSMAPAVQTGVPVPSLVERLGEAQLKKTEGLRKREPSASHPTAKMLEERFKALKRVPQQEKVRPQQGSASPQEIAQALAGTVSPAPSRVFPPKKKPETLAEEAPETVEEKKQAFKKMYQDTLEQVRKEQEEGRQKVAAIENLPEMQAAIVRRRMQQQEEEMAQSMLYGTESDLEGRAKQSARDVYFERYGEFPPEEWLD